MTGPTALCVFALLAAADPADEPQPDSSLTYDAPRDELEWRPEWRRFSLLEGIGTLALGGTAVAMRSAPVDNTATTRGGIWFDDPIRDAVGVNDPDAFRMWKAAGDWPYRVAMGWSLVDVFTAGAVHGNWDTAFQMLMIDLEAFAISGAVIWTSQYFVRRERPIVRHCAPGDPIGDQIDCSGGPGDNRSFIGGHVALTTTAAALTCLHHEKLPLYGGGIADTAACATWIAAAGTVFVSRTVLEKHYVTDNLLGAGLGVFSGYLVPKLLHYGFGTPDGDEEAETEVVFDGTPRLLGPSFTPLQDGEGFTVGVVGAL